MAESVVILLLGKLDSFLVEEARLLGGVRREVEEMIKELESMRSLLRDADTRADSDGGVKTWVKQVREDALDIEDILDEFTLRLGATQRQVGGGGRFIGISISPLFRKAFLSVQHLKARHRIATQIQDIKARVISTSARKDKYHLVSTAPENGSSSTVTSHSWYDPRVAALLLDEADIVGIEKQQHELIEWLLKGEEGLFILPVAGMGGLGKTTLVNKVFQRVKPNFQCFAWTTVSQSIKPEELLRDLIKRIFESRKEDVPQDLERETTLQRLLEMLKDYLQQKRYVLVFDDLWTTDQWKSIKHALPDNKCGSRIIITTRDRGVAETCIGAYGYVYDLQPLPPDFALDLFYKKAFPSISQANYPDEFKEVSQSILERCRGLPLAIVTIGGLLSTKKTLIEWQRVYSNLASDLERDDGLLDITRILLLSYYNLPYYLKHCFLYLGIFPEDYVIKSIRLIRLWIAEGFIQESEARTEEDVAEGYLMDLINRNMIQVTELTSYGRPIRCRVHDLMREVILIKCRDENFCRLSSKTNITSSEKIRRLSICNSVQDISQKGNLSKLRTLVMFAIDEEFPYTLGNFVSKFRLLKVLDMQGAYLKSFPDELSKLFHLKYLSLRNTDIDKLPKSVGKLTNIETFDLRGTSISELPIEILQLQKLRYLLAYTCLIIGSFKGVKVPAGIGNLSKSLQKLCYINANGEGILIKELQQLTELRRLGITELNKEVGVDLCTSIEKMNQLRSLSVCSIGEKELLDLQSLSFPPPLLQRLYIHGNLGILPHWLSSLKYLAKIRLRYSRLQDDPLKVLQALPSLADLSLYDDAYVGKELSIEARGFPRLKMLQLYRLRQLNLVRLEEGALPILEKLQIVYCRVLEKMPLGIEHITSLQEIEIRFMPDEFMKRIAKDGEDYPRVMHVPTIYPAP